ncbi:MAG: hypothetical protein ACLTAV_06680, partial [Finegoldia magna]
EPDYTKVGQFRVNIIFKLRKTQEISKSYVFIKIEKPVVEEKDNEKEPDENSIDKKSEKSQLQNENNTIKPKNSIQSEHLDLKSNKKKDDDTKIHDESIANVKNLKEEIR